jgi:hypothetical protein
MPNVRLVVRSLKPVNRGSCALLAGFLLALPALLLVGSFALGLLDFS